MNENIVPQKRNFGAPPERNFFADTGTPVSQIPSVPHKPATMTMSPAKMQQEAPTIETGSAAFDVPQKEVPTQETSNPAPETPKKTVEKPFEKSSEGLPTLRTYKQDVAGVVRDQKTSLVQMVLAEQRERRKRERETSPTSGRNLPLIILSVIFLLAAAGIVYYIFFTLKPANNALEELHVTPLVFSEKNTEVSITNKDRKTLRTEMSGVIQDRDLRLDAIKYVFFTDTLTVAAPQGTVREKSLASANKFFEVFEVELPSVILRSLRPEFMFGVHAFNKNQPFLVLKTDYYDNAFAGMLEWESNAVNDLLPLFDQPERVRELSERKWGDMVIKNKDTRVLRNFDGSIALVYMFKDQRTLIITTNEDTLLEVSRRLDTAQGRV